MVARRVACLIAAGAVVKVIVAFATYGQQFDIDSLALVNAVLRSPHRLELYEIGSRWPYPAGYFPFDYLAGSFAYRTGLPFHGVIQLWPIAADCAIAWLVQDELGRRGYGERPRLVATALVALGPMFLLVSGYHGQIDSVQTLLALGAVLVVAREGRPWVAGLLLGAAIAVKSPPVLLPLVLVPALPTWRARTQLAVPALAVPLLVTLPWLIGDFHATRSALTTYGGVPSLGGYSLIVEPSLVDAFLFGERLEPGATVRWLTDHQNLIVGLGALLAAIIARRRQLPVVTAVCLLYLAVWSFNPNGAYSYVLWGIPFLLVAGYLREVAVLQLVLSVPAAIVYSRTAEHWLKPPYLTVLIGVWVATVVWFIRFARTA